MKIVHDGQAYEQVGCRPHVRKDGTQTELLIWRSPCADCGAPFEMATSVKFDPAKFSRRCAAHRAPGHGATPAARARVARHLARGARS